MAVEQIQNLPQQYVTDLGVDYGKQLAGLTAIPLDTAKLAQKAQIDQAKLDQNLNIAEMRIENQQDIARMRKK